MNIPTSVQNILDSIEKLSKEEQTLLFKQLLNNIAVNLMPKIVKSKKKK
jgi:hypothetical protein